MLKFKQFIAELQLYHAGSKEGGIVDDAPKDKKERENTPIWLSHNKKAGRGYHKWHKNEGRKDVHLSKVHVKGKIAHHKDPYVRKWLNHHGHSNSDVHDYHDHLSYEASSDSSHHPVSKTLKRMGYAAYTHPDNAGDNKPNTVVFHRKHAKFTQTVRGKSPK